MRGNPDMGRAIVTCGNLTVRMSLRRFTRLTNAFSKKLGCLMLTSTSMHYASAHQAE